MTFLQSSQRSIRRFSMLALVLMVFSFFSFASAQQANAAPAGAPVNVPAVVLYVDCAAALANTTSVDFYYYRLDGTVGARTATLSNGGLTYNTGAPTVQFYNVSFDYSRTALYEFNFSNGDYYDAYLTLANWGRDARNGNVFATVRC